MSLPWLQNGVLKKAHSWPGVVAHTFNPRTQEAETDGSLGVQDQPELYIETHTQESRNQNQKTSFNIFLRVRKKRALIMSSHPQTCSY